MCGDVAVCALLRLWLVGLPIRVGGRGLVASGSAAPFLLSPRRPGGRRADVTVSAR
jgi:hypothetical protein